MVLLGQRTQRHQRAVLINMKLTQEQQKAFDDLKAKQDKLMEDGKAKMEQLFDFNTGKVKDPSVLPDIEALRIQFQQNALQAFSMFAAAMKSGKS